MKLVDLELGIHGQAWAVAHILNCRSEIDTGKVHLSTNTSAWYNGRERGICFTYASFGLKRAVHFIVYEHRNSDAICCIKWEADSDTFPNPPTINDIPEEVYPGKYTYAHREDYDGAGKMACWVFDQIKAFVEDLKATKGTAGTK